MDRSFQSPTSESPLLDAILGSATTPPVHLDDLLQPEFLFDITQLADEDNSPSAIQPSGSPPTNDNLLIPPPPTAAASIGIGFEPLIRPQIPSPPLASQNVLSPAPAILSPIPLPASKASAKNKPAARKRGRSAASAAAPEKASVAVDDEDDDDDERDHNSQQNAGDDQVRARLRTNETKYRQGMQQLFDSLGKALGQPGLGRKKLLEAAVARLKEPSAQATPLAPFPIDHRALFLTDSTPLAILSLDGRYLDANNALLQVCNHSLVELVARTIFYKIRDEQLYKKYRSVFEMVLTNPAYGERGVPLLCPATQQRYMASGYKLLMIFSVIMHVDQPKPHLVRMRLSPIPMHSEEYTRILPESLL